MTFVETLLTATIPALAVAIITYLRFVHELQRYKAETMAERTARHFLQHKGYTDRSFETLKKYLGGRDTDEDELRRILVRAGAVRSFRKEGNNETEWWTLLSRVPEKIKRKRQRKQ